MTIQVHLSGHLVSSAIWAHIFPKFAITNLQRFWSFPTRFHLPSLKSILMLSHGKPQQINKERKKERKKERNSGLVTIASITF